MQASLIPTWRSDDHEAALVTVIAPPVLSLPVSIPSESSIQPLKPGGWVKQQAVKYHHVVPPLSSSNSLPSHAHSNPDGRTIIRYAVP